MKEKKYRITLTEPRLELRRNSYEKKRRNRKGSKSKISL